MCCHQEWKICDPFSGDRGRSDSGVGFARRVFRDPRIIDSLHGSSDRFGGDECNCGNGIPGGI